HDPPRHALRRHLPRAQPRAPPGRGPDGEGLDPSTPESWRGTGATPAEAIAAYQRAAASKTDADRQQSREKSGIFTGSYALNPATGGEVPIFIADYVLMGYGTGAIMAVPAEDARDWDFAKTFGLP